MEKFFIATISIVIKCDDDAGAVDDAISGLFSEFLREKGHIVDWVYHSENGVYKHAQPVPPELVDKWDEHGTLCVLSGHSPE